MTDKHPITPPPELVEQWWWGELGLSEASQQQIATRAAQWGADQELEACCEVLDKANPGKCWSQLLRAARRPKPPSLKEQALIHFESYAASFETSGGDSDLIRRALEALPE